MTSTFLSFRTVPARSQGFWGAPHPKTYGDDLLRRGMRGAQQVREPSVSSVLPW
jgi:hypothetical protein